MPVPPEGWAPTGKAALFPLKPELPQARRACPT